MQPKLRIPENDHAGNVLETRNIKEVEGTQNVRAARVAVSIGRVFIFLGLISLLGAWISQLTGGSLFGLGQQHFFFDSIALSLLGIAFLIDGVPHSRGL